MSGRLFLLIVSSVYLTTSMPLLQADLSWNLESGYPFLSCPVPYFVIVSDAIGKHFDICNNAVISPVLVVIYGMLIYGTIKESRLD